MTLRAALHDHLTDSPGANDPTYWKELAFKAIDHVRYQIANAPLRLYPTPHIYVPEVFPSAFYATLTNNFPNTHDFKSMRLSQHGNYEINVQRHYLSYFDRDHSHLPNPDAAAFWEAFGYALSNQRFSATATNKFLPYLDHPRRALLSQHHDILMVSDRTGYDIGPHTDTPQKLFSLLFYCPETADHPHLGTSLFTQKDAAQRRTKRTDAWFRHGGDPALDFKAFDKIYTAPYVPNSLFGFVRTRYSYHGVETTGVTTPRRLIIYENFSMRSSRKLRAARET